MSASFIHKRRGYIGSLTVRTSRGSFNVHQWEKWRTVGRCNTLAEAQDNIDQWRSIQPGLYQDAIFHGNRKVFTQ